MHEEVALRLKRRGGGRLAEFGEEELARAAAEAVLDGALELTRCPWCGAVVLAVPAPTVDSTAPEQNQHAQASITHCGSRYGDWVMQTQEDEREAVQAHYPRHARQVPGDRRDLAMGSAV